MPTELEEVSSYPALKREIITNTTKLVGFIASPNPQIRKLAIENLVPYSVAEPAIFKAEGLTPVKNLKILIRDHPVSFTRRPSSMTKGTE